MKILGFFQFFWFWVYFGRLSSRPLIFGSFSEPNGYRFSSGIKVELATGKMNFVTLEIVKGNFSYFFASFVVYWLFELTRFVHEELNKGGKWLVF